MALPPSGPPTAVGHHLLGLGPEAAIITDGGSGSYLWSKTAHVHVPARSVTVKDTVGGRRFLHVRLDCRTDGGPPPGEFDAAKLTRLGTAASLAAAITVGRTEPTRPHEPN